MEQKERNWIHALLLDDTTLAAAIKNLDFTSLKIVLITYVEGRFIGTISDGDIRRGLLRGLSLESEISSIINSNALVVPPNLGRDYVKNIMSANKIYQIPIVDAEHKVCGLHLWDELVETKERTNLFVIMAGGVGKRLYPQTENCPKPMLKVGGKPILEHIINHAKSEGFNKYVLAINYLGHIIEEYFGDGSKFGIEIEYLKESTPLGTVGALSLFKSPPKEPFIVTNGDVISGIHFNELLDFHLQSTASATMAVRLHEWEHPFGVVKTRGFEIIGFEEKPVSRSYINAGVYALNPEALGELLPNMFCDMPTLFQKLNERRMKTVAYPMHEGWKDIGSPIDLHEMNQEDKE
jgi:dTDP-glucose pyrophosphorylase